MSSISNSMHNVYRALGMVAIAALAAVPLLASAPAPGFRDPLDHPAEMREAPATRAFQAMTQAGDRVVAVGLRGMIAVSDDAGATWVQKPGPVQSDLLAVFFLDSRLGWASGHDGVILHTVDGGESWVPQLDGRRAAATLPEWYRERIDAGEVDYQPFLEEVELNYRGGPSLPFLGIWFENASKGYAVGSFGMLLATEDGGATWRPALHEIDNPEYLHLNAIDGRGGVAIIASERGTLFRRDAETGRFEQVDTGHTGSFFSVAINEQTVVAGALRGVVYASRDAGRTWTRAEAPLTQTVSGAHYIDASRRFVLVTIGGEVASAGHSAGMFETVPIRQGGLFTSVAAVGDAVLIAGMQGIVRQPLAQASNEGDGR